MRGEPANLGMPTPAYGPRDGLAADESVTCTIRGVGDSVRWGIAVKTAPGWALEETTYPRILVAKALGGDAGDDRFVYGTAKGGVVINITDVLSVPVRFAGVGEGIDDLRSFEPGDFARALF